MGWRRSAWYDRADNEIRGTRQKEAIRSLLPTKISSDALEVEAFNETAEGKRDRTIKFR